MKRIRDRRETVLYIQLAIPSTDQVTIPQTPPPFPTPPLPKHLILAESLHKSRA